jgi:hypothetical protein
MDIDVAHRSDERDPVSPMETEGYRPVAVERMCVDHVRIAPSAAALHHTADHPYFRPEEQTVDRPEHMANVIADPR